MSPINEEIEPKDKPEEEEIDRKLQEYIQKRERLKKAFHEGKVSREKFIEIHEAIEGGMQHLKNKKITTYRKEKEDLRWDQLDLDKDLDEEIITEKEYQERKDEIDKKVAELESKIHTLESKKEIPGYFDLKEKAVDAREYSLFSPELWLILTIFGVAAFIGIILSFTLIFTSISFLGSSHMPFQYKSLVLSQLILVPFLIVIGVLTGAFILYVSANIAGIKKVTFNRALICTIAILVVGFGSRVIYAFLSMGIVIIAGIIGVYQGMILGDIFSIIFLILWLILAVPLSIWIIRDGFNTQWRSAGVTWVFMVILGAAIIFVIGMLSSILFR